MNKLAIEAATDGPELPVRRLLAEWPATEPEPVQFCLSLPADNSLATLVRTAKLRRGIEHDFHERKQALGLAHFEAAPSAPFSASTDPQQRRRRPEPGTSRHCTPVPSR